ncbi:MAG TPA: AAA family ATPase [Gemmatimonadaceae bacterium]|nr:AAA family ATPase [Gemmatimonadaceae bacterium]
MAPIVPTPTTEQRAQSGLTRVVVTGSESTGKTELARALASHYGTTWVPEFARDYAERMGGALTAADVAPIAAGHLALEDAAVKGAHGILFLDTDLVNTVVYAEHYYGAADPWITQAAQNRLADLYLLCDIDHPWVADGVRDAQPHRGKMHDAFERHLSRFGATFRIVSGHDPVERLRRAIAHVEEWRRTRQR